MLKMGWEILTGLFPRPLGPVPVYSSTDKVPRMSEISQHRLVLLHGLLPLILHQAILSVTGQRSLRPYLAFMLYFYAFYLAGRHQVYSFRMLSRRIGYFDGHRRTKKDSSTGTEVGPRATGFSMARSAIVRAALPILLSFEPARPPISALGSPSWWCGLFCNISLYIIILDFWYYLVHRAAHEITPLWRAHRKHHTIRHPSIRFTAYASMEQELWDVIGAPTLAYYTMCAFRLPMFDFYSWWICLQYVNFAEIGGHSGLRVHWNPPLTFNPLLKLFNAELSIEDHDLHHRLSSRSTVNYGKQTRVWDRLFGTAGARIETQASNIDNETVVEMPFFEGLWGGSRANQKDESK